MHRPAGRAERLYREVAAEYGGALERLARAYEQDADRRRDLLQEIHVALWRSLARFEGRCSMRTWVYRVAHNVATTHVVRAKAQMPAFLSIDEIGSVAVTPDEEALIDRGRVLDRLHALIRQLHPPDRQVMLLYLEELDAATIAEVTGLSAGGVATRIHRIKRLLAARFHGRGAGDERA
jgi:RNA polymerase sigma-70 factor (ECF subfamily)